MRFEGLAKPKCTAVATSENGCLGISMEEQHRIAVVNESNKVVSSFDCEYPGQLAFGRGQDLFVICTKGRCVRKFPEGTVVLSCELFPHSIAMLDDGCTPVVSQNDNHYHVTHASETWHANTKVGPDVYITFSRLKYQFHSGVAVLKNGDVVVADNNNDRIGIFSKDKQFIQTHEVRLGLSSPRGIAVLPDPNYLLVCDTAYGQVALVNLNEQKCYERVWRGLCFPRTVAHIPGRGVFVTDRRKKLWHFRETWLGSARSEWLKACVGP